MSNTPGLSNTQSQYFKPSLTTSNFMAIPMKDLVKDKKRYLRLQAKVRELEKKLYAEDTNSFDMNDKRSSSAWEGQELPPAQILPKTASENPDLSPETFSERGKTPDF